MTIHVVVYIYYLLIKSIKSTFFFYHNIGLRAQIYYDLNQFIVNFF